MLLAALDDGREVKAVWNSKFHERLRVYVVRDGAIEEKAELPDLAAVDAWAGALGVTGWTLHKTTRVSPFAAALPIHFPKAPPPERLEQALAQVRAGANFVKLAAEVLGTDPVTARAWLMGYQPGCPDIARMEVPGLATDDIMGGQF